MELNIPKPAYKRIIVVGGGFAGLSLVRKLAGSIYQVVLLDRRNCHQFQPLLYQVASAALSPGDILFPFRKVFRGKKNVFFRMTDVRKVDPARKTVHTADGAISYDYLVLAAGSTTNFYGMERIEKVAYPMKDAAEALVIRNRVLAHIEKAIMIENPVRKRALLNIVIVGGGATGVEVAGAFADMKRQVMRKDYPTFDQIEVNIYLLEGSDKILGAMSPETSRDARRLLTEMGVKVMLNALVKDYADGEVKLGSGEAIPTDNLIWCSGVKSVLPEGLENAQRGRGGRAVTDDYMRLPGFDGLYAVGDISIQHSERHPDGLPQLARVAIEQAAAVAKNLLRIAHAKPEIPFRYVEYPVLATIGRNRAFAEYGKIRLTGFIAWCAWAAVHLFTVLGVRNKFYVLWGWFWNYMTFDMPTRVIVEQDR